MDEASVSPEQKEAVMVALRDAFPGVEDELLVRVARHRKYDLEKSLEKARVYLDWRQGIEGISLADVGSGIFESGAMWFGGEEHHDKAGRAMVCFRAGLWDPSHFSGDESEAFVNLFAEMLCSSERVQTHGLAMMGDMQGMGWRNFDRNLEKLWLDTLQSKVPVSLGAMRILNPGWIVRTLLRIVLPWMKAKLRERVQQIYGAEELLEHVDAEHLPQELGGSLRVDWHGGMKQMLSSAGKKAQK